MLKAGVQLEAVRMKMTQDGISSEIVSKFHTPLKYAMEVSRTCCEVPGNELFYCITRNIVFKLLYLFCRKC